MSHIFGKKEGSKKGVTATFLFHVDVSSLYIGEPNMTKNKTNLTIISFNVFLQ